MKDTTFNEAKQLYLEQYASAIVTSGYLKIAVTLLSLVVFWPGRDEPEDCPNA